MCARYCTQRLPVAYAPLHLPTLASNAYSIATEKAGNALVMPLRLRVSMVAGDRLLTLSAIRTKSEIRMGTASESEALTEKRKEIELKSLAEVTRNQKRDWETK
ncbi:hypothetical protein EVAR_60071_1 [Eumeta japonica]|uniref:Uncharacterized protein n=1 Tax=Eumeta variegata TaxID=151549 RepID=A0A4C1ZMD8_EUMVA|nr:hypothetical protein EVAR_60071_1 [Eumeta japonica]